LFSQSFREMSIFEQPGRRASSTCSQFIRDNSSRRNAHVTSTPSSARSLIHRTLCRFGACCRAALMNENCISRVFSSFSRLSASGMALNCKKPGTKYGTNRQAVFRMQI
jgi:hypothetical protein